jgi:WS/DGAT C-terminal domain
VSNVPGPQFPLYVLGARLLELYPLPPLFERQGLGTAVMSYDGSVCWGLVADRDSVPDLGSLARDLDAAFEELRKASRGSRPRAGPPDPPRRGVRQPSDAARGGAGNGSLLGKGVGIRRRPSGDAAKTRPRLASRRGLLRGAAYPSFSDPESRVRGES